MAVPGAVDLVSSDEQPEGRAQTPPHAHGDGLVGPSDGICKQPQQSHSVSIEHTQQDVPQESKPVTVASTHVQDAAVGEGVPAAPQTDQEEHLQRSDSSSINPSMAPVRRFKGVPYAPPADSTQFLTNMGFSQDQAIRALKVTQGNIERAANWLLSGM